MNDYAIVLTWGQIITRGWREGRRKEGEGRMSSYAYKFNKSVFGEKINKTL